MKFKYFFLFFILILGFFFHGCKLKDVDYTKITSDNFFENERDAELAIAALYNRTRGLFSQANSSWGIVNDVSSGDGLMGVWGTEWELLFNHEWSEVSPVYTDFTYEYYNRITEARQVSKQIAQMDISEDIKKPLQAEANALAGWVAALLYDFYGPVPYPSDANLGIISEGDYPVRPTNDEFVSIIESLFSGMEDLPDVDFGSAFGRMNKQLANYILMRLYMLEAGRTEKSEFWEKALDAAYNIMSSGKYQLQDDYNFVFSMDGVRNNEIIFAPASSYDFGGNQWHVNVVASTVPSPISMGGIGGYAVYRIVWPFFDTFDKANDYRTENILDSFISTPERGSILIDREHPFDMRAGVGGGPFPMKYETDWNQVGAVQGEDWIIYRYADVILCVAEASNELSKSTNFDAPVMSNVSKDGKKNLYSEGGRDPVAFLNAIRVRAGLDPLSGLTQSQLRDSILLERSREFYAEGLRRTDLIRYQRVTNGNGYKIFDPDEEKFLFPIPIQFIDEFKGNLAQNPGY